MKDILTDNQYNLWGMLKTSGTQEKTTIHVKIIISVVIKHKKQ